MTIQFLTPAAFVAKWRRAKLSERAASQEHFIDLCRLLGQPTPAEHDATGAEYTFEKGINIIVPGALGLQAGHGFADVWWDGKFGWEYKRQGKYKTLEEAYRQLQQYREALNNPPLLVVCDIARTEIHTNFTNTPSLVHVVTLDDIEQGPGLELLRRVFTDPESFKPAKTSTDITIEVAEEFAKIAIRLEDRGHDPQTTAHFLMKVMFCLFAEDIDLLPDKLFKKLIDSCHDDPPRFKTNAARLFAAMRTGGEEFLAKIPYFNGGLFDHAPPLDLYRDELGILRLAANQDWSAIEPSILGTLFERSLDPSKRAQIGAHFTAKDDILLVVKPVIIDPLRAQWVQLREVIAAELSAALMPPENGTSPPRPAPQSKIENRKSKIPCPLTSIHEKIAAFLAKLAILRILDPACGSANFLYVAIQQLLDLEKEIITFAAQPPISLRLLPRIRPTQLYGLEINRYAAELAQISIWIGFLQWMHANGYQITDQPILSNIHTIANRDAILDFSTPSEISNSDISNPQISNSEISNPKSSLPSPHPQSKIKNEKSKMKNPPTNPLPLTPRPSSWPPAHFIVGNPPFLGSKLFRAHGLPDDYLAALYQAYDLPKTSDLCCYWFELARRQIESAHPSGADAPVGPSSPGHKTKKPTRASAPLSAQSLDYTLFPNLALPRVGLLATQGIRGTDNRTVLQRIKQSGDIFMAWSDKEWILDGAAVNVSIIAFARGPNAESSLDGVQVPTINSDLSSGADTTQKTRLLENATIAFMADTKGGAFDLEWTDARTLLASPNPNGKPSLDVLRPWVNGLDIIRRDRAMWIIDFGCETNEAEAAGYEAAFERVRKHVYPERKDNRRQTYAERWWIHVEPRPAMRGALPPSRFLATPNLTKHRAFCWIDGHVLADHQLIVFARSDDYFFGVLHSVLHELWSLETGTQLEDRPRYTATTTFETFPLPWPPGHEPGTPNFPGNSALRIQHSALQQRIAEAAKELNDLRERWLNPPELLEPLVRILDANDKFEDVPAEARPLLRHSALMAAAAPQLKKRTLTNLYNQRPTWLQLAHEKLDRAVLAAYAAIDPDANWSEDWAALYTETGGGQPLPATHPRHAERLATDQKILANLLRLNHLRAQV